jgi:tetratricopeptide (TPR) repeat protein
MTSNRGTWIVVLAGACVVLCGSAGCVLPVSPEARQLLVDGRAAYDRGDDPAVLRQTNAFLAQHARSSLSDVAYYLRGLAAYRQQNLPAARADLQAALAATTRRDIRLGSQKALGDLAYEDGDMGAADSFYRQALAECEGGARPSDEIGYRLGCALQAQGRWGEADEQFDRVAHVFAGSEIARRAERRLRCVAWTIQAGAYEKKATADAEAVRLRAAHLPANTRPVVVGDKLRFFVQAGWYDTRDKAAALLPAVRKARPDAFIIPSR